MDDLENGESEGGCFVEGLETNGFEEDILG